MVPGTETPSSEEKDRVLKNRRVAGLIPFLIVGKSVGKGTSQKRRRKLVKRKGLDTQPQKRQHQTLKGSERSSNELGHPHTEVGKQAGVADMLLTRRSCGKSCIPEPYCSH